MDLSSLELVVHSASLMAMIQPIRLVPIVSESATKPLPKGSAFAVIRQAAQSGAARKRLNRSGANNNNHSDNTNNTNNTNNNTILNAQKRGQA